MIRNPPQRNHPGPSRAGPSYPARRRQRSRALGCLAADLVLPAGNARCDMPSDDLTVEQLAAIDRLCAAFKQAWHADPQTTIAAFLDRVAPELRGHLEKRLQAI